MRSPSTATRESLCKAMKTQPHLKKKKKKSLSMVFCYSSLNGLIIRDQNKQNIPTHIMLSSLHLIFTYLVRMKWPIIWGFNLYFPDYSEDEYLFTFFSYQMLVYVLYPFLEIELSLSHRLNVKIFLNSNPLFSYVSCKFLLPGCGLPFRCSNGIFRWTEV